MRHVIMSGPATIDHQEVHINVTKHGTHANRAVTVQPSRSTSQTVQYDGKTAMAIFTQSPVPVVAQKPDPKLKPKDFVITSCIIVFICNFIFGLLGYHFGVKSNYAWQLGDTDMARRHAKKALLFVILGAVVGITTYTVAFILYFAVYKTPINVDTSRPG